MPSLPRLNLEKNNFNDPNYLLDREWLVTNGLGGFASSTLMNVSTRRYHGIFVPHLSRGRTVMLPRLDETVETSAEHIHLSGAEFANGSMIGQAHQCLQEFYLQGHKPVWIYKIKNSVLRKTIFMPYGFNTLIIVYEIISGDALQLQLRPFVSYRSPEDMLGHSGEWPIEIKTKEYSEVTIFQGAPVMHWAVKNAPVEMVTENYMSQDNFYRVEKERGYDSVEVLKSPGYFRIQLKPNQPAYFVCSVEGNFGEINPQESLQKEEERISNLLTHLPENEKNGLGAHLTLAADQFIIFPGSRIHKDESGNIQDPYQRSVIAGYHWFTDWGRDTMISLEGLTLSTRRYKEARAILRTFSRYVKDGLIPNLFPEGEKQGLYHTVDATLWFFHAIDRYFTITKDEETLAFLYPILVSIIDHHFKGTHFGIQADPQDGLIKAGAEGYQLTWMDAKVGNWVVTPRRGKPVEIQALWYNALKLMAHWANHLSRSPEPYEAYALKVEASFNQRFWYAGGKYLYDVVDSEQGDDTALRPNQIFSIALRFPVLRQEYWQPVLDIVTKELLTAYGLRTLTRSHPDYKFQYYGDQMCRDAAYHQGMVWPWLIGAYANSCLRVHGDRNHVLSLIQPFQEHLKDAGIGSISEIFDAEDPHLPKGCIAQAWSVAEVLRLWTQLHPST